MRSRSITESPISGSSTDCSAFKTFSCFSASATTGVVVFFSSFTFSSLTGSPYYRRTQATRLRTTVSRTLSTIDVAIGAYRVQPLPRSVISPGRRPTSGTRSATTSRSPRNSAAAPARTSTRPSWLSSIGVNCLTRSLPGRDLPPHRQNPGRVVHEWCALRDKSKIVRLDEHDPVHAVAVDGQRIEPFPARRESDRRDGSKGCRVRDHLSFSHVDR